MRIMQNENERYNNNLCGLIGWGANDANNDLLSFFSEISSKIIYFA